MFRVDILTRNVGAVIHIFLTITDRQCGRSNFQCKVCTTLPSSHFGQDWASLTSRGDCRYMDQSQWPTGSATCFQQQIHRAFSRFVDALLSRNYSFRNSQVLRWRLTLCWTRPTRRWQRSGQVRSERWPSRIRDPLLIMRVRSGQANWARWYTPQWAISKSRLASVSVVIVWGNF